MSFGQPPDIIVREVFWAMICAPDSYEFLRLLYHLRVVCEPDHGNPDG
jgi:hypothetical protein